MCRVLLLLAEGPINPDRPGGDELYIFFRDAVDWNARLPEGHTFKVEARAWACTNISTSLLMQVVRLALPDACCIIVLYLLRAFILCSNSPTCRVPMTRTGNCCPFRKLPYSSQSTALRPTRRLSFVPCTPSKNLHSISTIGHMKTQHRMQSGTSASRHVASLKRLQRDTIVIQ